MLAAAAAGIALNFALLGLTQREDDPVGKLSPRAIVERGTTGASIVPPPTSDDGGTTSGDNGRDHGRDHHDDDD